MMKNAPHSIKNAIKAINAADGSSKGFQEENFQFSDCFGTADFEEGIALFWKKENHNFNLLTPREINAPTLKKYIGFFP
jgi:enoyl-CoA hydratase/carnithine racemase